MASDYCPVCKKLVKHRLWDDHMAMHRGNDEGDGGESPTEVRQREAAEAAKKAADEAPEPVEDTPEDEADETPPEEDDDEEGNPNAIDDEEDFSEDD